MIMITVRMKPLKLIITANEVVIMVVDSDEVLTEDEDEGADEDSIDYLGRQLSVS